MNDRAGSAHSQNNGGGTPLTQWGSEAGDSRDSEEIDDAFAELLAKSPVRSGDDAGPSDEVDPTPLIDGFQPTVTVDWRKPTGAAPDDADPAETFTLLSYLLEAEPPGLDDDGSHDRQSDDSNGGEAAQAPATATADHTTGTDNEPPNVGPAAHEGPSDNSELNRQQPESEPAHEPELESAGGAKQHPADLIGTTLYSSETLTEAAPVDGDVEVGGETRILGAEPLWQPEEGQPAWHPAAPVDLQHSAVVNWDGASLPLRSVRSPGEPRRPRSAADFVGEVADRPGFWKSLAGVAFVLIGAAFYSIGFFDEALGRNSDTTASQIVTGEAALPSVSSEAAESLDPLSDLQSALSDPLLKDGQLDSSTGSGGADDLEPASPARRRSDSIPGPAEDTTTTSEAEESTTSRPDRSSTTTTEASLPTTAETTAPTTRRSSTTTTTVATTTTEKEPPGRGSGKKTTTTTTASTTSTTVEETSTTEDTEPTTTTSGESTTSESTSSTTEDPESTTTTTDASTSSSIDGEGGE